MRTLGVAAALLASLGAVTLAALEGGEVVVLRTGVADARRETRTWIAESDGVWWIEAASENRPFFRDVEADPRVEVRRAGRWHRCRAAIAPDPDGHDRIRELLRTRYGWRDWWIGWLADMSASRALRLECEAA